MNSPADHYKGFTDLASAQVEGTDYRVHVRANAGSAVAVIAPHGGSIEQYTSDVARDMQGRILISACLKEFAKLATIPRSS